MSWKNEHLSENLAIGTLMSQQKNQKFKNTKKEKNWKIQKNNEKTCLVENLETGALVAKIQKNYKKS